MAALIICHSTHCQPAASGGQTVLANDRNGGRLRLIASRHDDDDDDDDDTVSMPGSVVDSLGMQQKWPGFDSRLWLFIIFFAFCQNYFFLWYMLLIQLNKMYYSCFPTVVHLVGLVYMYIVQCVACQSVKNWHYIYDRHKYSTSHFVIHQIIKSNINVICSNKVSLYAIYFHQMICFQSLHCHQTAMKCTCMDGWVQKYGGHC